MIPTTPDNPRLKNILYFGRNSDFTRRHIFYILRRMASTLFDSKWDLSYLVWCMDFGILINLCAPNPGIGKCWFSNHWPDVARNHGSGSIQRCHLTSIGNLIVEIRRSYDRLISTMGFPILVRWHLYIESEPRRRWADNGLYARW